MRKTVYYKILGLSLVLLLFFGCRRENTYWEDDFVAPLAHGNLNLGTMFPDTTIKSNADSSLKIAFSAQLINYGLDSLLKIPDTTVSTVSTNTLFPIQIQPGYPLFSSTTDTYYDLPNGIELTSASIRQGRVKVDLSNTVRQPLVYHYQLLSARRNNVLLDTTFQIPKAVYSGTVLVTAGTNSCYINLSGYDIDFTGTNHNQTNTVEQFGEISVATTAQTDTIYKNEGLIANFTFSGIIPQYAKGYFGNQSITLGPDTASFDVFKNIRGGMLNLSSASVNLQITNQFGVDMRATVQSLNSINTHNPSTVPLTTLAPINITRAFDNGPYAPVTATVKNIYLNQNNSNITTFIGNLPDQLAYKLTAQVNPPPTSISYNDFAYYGTGFKAYLNADIPLYFSASNILLADTVPLTLSDVNQFKNINRGNLILTATNSYPFSINLQGYLLDENKNIIDVLFSAPNTVQAPMLDANFKVIAPAQSKLYVPLSQTKISNLERAHYIYYSATFNTASQPNQIKFYDYYTLDLLLTADINYTIGK